MRRLIGRLSAAALLLTLAGGATAIRAAAPFTLSSSSFKDGDLLGVQHAGALPGKPNCVGKNVSPALRWSNLPEGTRSIAIVMVDPEGRNGLGVYHWVAYGIRPELGGFEQGAVSQDSAAYVGGLSTQGFGHYTGPCTPPGTTDHHYNFVAIATSLAPDALPPGLSYPDLLARLAGHTLASSGLVGRFHHP